MNVILQITENDEQPQAFWHVVLVETGFSPAPPFHHNSYLQPDCLREGKANVSRAEEPWSEVVELVVT